MSEDVSRWEAGDPAFRAERNQLRTYRKVAAQVIVLRTRLGMSQEELARRMGTSKSAIVRLESGRHKPSMETLRRVAEAFGGELEVTIEIPDGPDRVRPSAVAF